MKFPWSRREPKPPRPPRRGLSGFLRRHFPGLFVIALVTLLIGFVLYPFMLVTVPSGHAGVLWKRFSGPGFYCLCIVPSGTVLDTAEVRKEGLHVIWPWDRLFIYSMRLQVSTQKFHAISSDGVSVNAEITLRYQLDFNALPVLHQFIGPKYLQTVLTPEIANVTRSTMAKYSAQEIYSTRRGQVQAEIKDAAIDSLRQHLDKLFQASASEQSDLAQYQTSLQNSIQVIDTLVLNIELPKDIVAAINRKIEQFYAIQEYQYRVQREVEEARRKRVEANGIAAFQRTVSEGISESFLRWQGIQATLQLAQSKNSKIVIIGNSKDGLPLILGNVDTPSERPTAPPATPKRPPSDQVSPSADRKKNAIDSDVFERVLSRLFGVRGSDKNTDRQPTDKSDKTEKSDKTDEPDKSADKKTRQ
jgi:regulator of protease activity HflC (stomatin/prohibitin superfamily)